MFLDKLLYTHTLIHLAFSLNSISYSILYQDIDRIVLFIKLFWEFLAVQWLELCFLQGAWVQSLVRKLKIP